MGRAFPGPSISQIGDHRSVARQPALKPSRADFEVSSAYELGDSRFAVPPRWLIETQVFGFCCDWRFRK